MKMLCKYCGEDFTTKNPFTRTCVICSYYHNIFQDARGKHLPPSEAHLDYKIQVTYAVRQEGYCIDTYEKQVHYRVMERTFQLVRAFENPQLGLVDSPLVKRYYSREKDVHNGRHTYYKIIKAKIVSAQEKDKNVMKFVKTVPSDETHSFDSDDEWELPED